MSPSREVRWEYMFLDELESAFARYPLVYFPYGLCEPHGPHNTLGLDALKAHKIACIAAHEYGGIVAPPDYWHIHGFGGYAAWAAQWIGEVPRPWLTCMPPWMHFKNICYHIRAADVLGFHAAILLTGHYGPNWEDLKTLVTRIQPYVGTRLYTLPDFEANQPGFDNDGESTGDHAGKVETSLLWALHPECVDISRQPGTDQVPTIDPKEHFAMGPDARQASRKIGERMVADEVRWLGQKGNELLAEYDRLRPNHTLRTFADVEKVWLEVVEPLLGDFICMQATWEQDPPPPPSSVWRENWQLPLIRS
jgi:creatinine amidohydrolase/Fe(II)-dependent formamide hydrolase-like protein